MPSAGDGAGAGGHELTQMCDPEAGDTVRTLSSKTVTGRQRTVDLRLRNTDACSTPTSWKEDLPRQQGPQPKVPLWWSDCHLVPHQMACGSQTQGACGASAPARGLACTESLKTG